MCLDGLIAPKTVVSLNGALLPLTGRAARIFSPLAKLMTAMPHTPHLFAFRARHTRMVDDLMTGTGSVLAPAQIELYRRLGTNPGHVAAAIAMMAHWDLRPLRHDLPRLGPHLVLVAAGNDRTIPPATATEVNRLVPGSEVVALPGLGHLAHEEDPDQLARLITAFA
jgi:magnesium chelatase accessory protein